MTFEDQSGLVAERIFVALTALDQLSDAVSDRMENSAQVSVGELYRHVRDPEAFVTRALIDGLENDVQLRADFSRLVAKNSQCRFPIAAAASSGGVARRDGDGFQITLRKSRAEPSQIYIIIDLRARDEAPPTHLFVLGEEIRYCKHRLPLPLDGTIQLLAEDGSDIVRALEDHQSEVFLR
jgi:hypothetical protein